MAIAVAICCVAVLMTGGGFHIGHGAAVVSLTFVHDLTHPFAIAMAAVGAVSAEAMETQLKELSSVATKLEKASDEVRKNGEKLQAEMKAVGDASAETKTAVDKAISEHAALAKQHSEIAGRVTEIEQTLSQRRKESNPEAPKSIGQMFVESTDFKKFGGATGRGNVQVTMPRSDITGFPSTVGNNTSQGTSLQPAMRVPGIVTPISQKLTIRDLLAPGRTSQALIEYVQETGYTNNAAVVTEGQSKPYSDLTFELKNAPVRTVAHLFKASRQILDDAPALQSYIDARARYGLQLAEETELLSGDGTGSHIKGLIPSATTFDASFLPTAQQNIDIIRLAILQVYLAKIPASGIVLNPIDWAKIQLTKDSQNRYIVGNPVDGNVQRLWNLPVVDSLSMTADKFLVGAFDFGAQIFDRLEIEVLLSTENSVDFEKNMVTLRAEERLALAIYRPEAFVTGTFSTAT